MGFQRHLRTISIVAALTFLAVACVVQGRDSAAQKLWWSGFGPVLPHDTFPGDCGLCHIGDDWQRVSSEFEYDHEGETGYKLEGAHERATCLRCHNDRGPVEIFEARGCAGCHEDIHVGQLGADCLSCHTQQTWQPYGQYAKHNETRFPLIGVHASTSCHRCHPGAEIGRFVPTDTECVTCHTSDLARANNPPHIALGFVDRCDRCHLPRTWNQAEIDN
ncbi:MAG: hypothetical protein SGI72_10325 [Planctomycetota bacterium]|nr:hypothetical protein [Planctomycetota bacterium]